MSPRRPAAAGDDRQVAGYLRVSTRESGPTNAHKVNFQLVIDALASGTSTLFYCHCHTDLARAGTAALVLSDQTELAVGEIAQLDLRRLESLTLVACASGQPNPFVGPISVAHAAALAGVRQLVFSLWPITAAHGARFVAGLLDDLASGGTTPDYLAALHITSPLRAAPFGVMRR